MPIVKVTAAVIVRDRHILVCQRSPEAKHHPNKWEFPGGKVEADEGRVSGLRRELQEELGITAEIGRLLHTVRHRYPGRDSIELSFFEVERFTGVLTNRVFAQVRWLQPEELAALDFLDADLDFVHRLAAGEIRLSFKRAATRPRTTSG